MHHHAIGIGTLALGGLLVFQGPHLLDTVRSTIAPVQAHRLSPDAAAHALLGGTMDATLEAGHTGRIDKTLGAFSSGVQRQTGITDAQVDVIENAARSPEAQGALRAFVQTVKHPPVDSAALPPGTRLPPASGNDDLMNEIGRAIRSAFSAH